MVKIAIEGLGANKTTKAIAKAAKAIGVLSEITESFDLKVGINAPSDKHSSRQMTEDLQKIVKQLLECDVFNPTTKKPTDPFFI